MDNSTILFVTSCGQDNIKKLESFIKIFTKNNLSLSILFENSKDYNFFKTNTKNKFVNNLNLNNLIKKYELKDYSFNINANYYSFFDNNKEFEINYTNSYMLIDSIFKEFKIQNCIINFGQGVLNSFHACVINDYCKHNNIGMFFPMSNSPLNGRFMIYDNIFQNSKIFSDHYTNSLNKFNNIDKEEIFKFKNSYFLNEINYNKRVNKFKSKINLLNFKNLLSILKDLFYKKFLYHKKIANIKNQKPYILLLLNKSNNHWYTKFANPNLLDRKLFIENILNQLPDKYNLIIKCHPRKKFELELERQFYNNKKICIVYENTKDPNTYLTNLLDNAEYVIGSSTTSQIVALLFNKLVIDVGSKSAYFNFDNPPVIRLKELKNMNQVNKNINFSKYLNLRIDAYFYSLMKISVPFNYSSKISHITDEKTHSLMAQIIINQIYKKKN